MRNMHEELGNWCSSECVCLCQVCKLTWKNTCLPYIHSHPVIRTHKHTQIHDLRSCPPTGQLKSLSHVACQPKAWEDRSGNLVHGLTMLILPQPLTLHLFLSSHSPPAVALTHIAGIFNHAALSYSLPTSADRVSSPYLKVTLQDLFLTCAWCCLFQ